MEWYKNALLGAGLLGLSSLAGYGCESVKSETSLTLSNGGRTVLGKIDGININYHLFGGQVWLQLEKSDASRITITDENTIDGNLNYFFLSTLNNSNKYFFCEDNGDITYLKNFAQEETKKLKEWGNKKLEEVYEMCKGKFGDRLKIPYKQEKKPERSLDDILGDYDF